MRKDRRSQNEHLQIEDNTGVQEKQVPKLFGSALAYKAVLLLLICGFLVGVGIMLHPFAERLLFRIRSASQADRYQRAVSQYAPGSPEAIEAEKEFKRAQEYNAQHAANMIGDPFADEYALSEDVSGYGSMLDPMGNGMMGILEIPKISQRLCIYHGVEEKTLLQGVGHIPGSSLPVGGESSHCVLTGHRGLAAATILTDLNQMKTGDRFYLHVLNHDMAYEVDQILVVLPSEISALDIVPGEDLVTLVTCTPYAVNSHRLLVRGHRIPYDRPETMSPINMLSLRMMIIFAVIIAIILLIVIMIIRKMLRKRRTGRSGRG